MDDEKDKTAPSLPDPELTKSQLEKLRAEIAKLTAETEGLNRQSRSENVRFWVPIAAPFVGSIALVSTLIFQVVQFSQNARLTRQTTETTEYRAVLQGAEATSSKSAQAAISMSRLASFLSSEKFGADTRRDVAPAGRTRNLGRV